jgi:hypothetical protein
MWLKGDTHAEKHWRDKSSGWHGEEIGRGCKHSCQTLSLHAYRRHLEAYDYNQWDWLAGKESHCSIFFPRLHELLEQWQVPRWIVLCLPFPVGSSSSSQVLTTSTCALEGSCSRF